MIWIQRKSNAQLPYKREVFRTLREVKDTPENHKDILRWADVVGHTIEERRSEQGSSEVAAFPKVKLPLLT